MKKKILIFALLAISTLSLSACGQSSVDLKNYLIEERTNLFTASDDIYSTTFSTGKREADYNFDGVINEMQDFGILTLSRNDNSSLATDTYTYILTINDEQHTGFLTKNPTDNNYSADLGVTAKNDDIIKVQISFTGYTFNKDMSNISNEFSVDSNAALKIANKQLKEDIENVTQDNAKIEVVMKILKDYSSGDLKNYYWYVGVVSTNGETLGILIDSSSGNVVAKKV